MIKINLLNLILTSNCVYVCVCVLCVQSYLTDAQLILEVLKKIDLSNMNFTILPKSPLSLGGKSSPVLQIRPSILIK